MGPLSQKNLKNVSIEVEEKVKMEELVNKDIKNEVINIKKKIFIRRG